VDPSSFTEVYLRQALMCPCGKIILLA
jgi:hypothetical protein